VTPSRSACALGTIVALSDIPYAEVLCSSYRKHHPTHDCVVLVVDARTSLQPFSQAHFVTPADLDLPLEEFHRWATMYELPQLVDTLTPVFLEWLLSRGYGTVRYLEPGVEVVSAFSEWDEPTSSSGVTLTPRLLRPLRDEHTSRDREVLTHGAFHSGCLEVTTMSRDFLSWWRHCLSRDHVAGSGGELSYQQHWIDLAPAYFDVRVVRHPGYNIGPWNLHERPLEERSDASLRVANEPVRSVHFATTREGHNYSSSSVPAENSAGNPTLTPSVFSRLEATFQDRVQNASSSRFTNEPYRFTWTDNGVRLTREFRAIYRDALVDAERFGHPMPPVPFGTDDAQFSDWLDEPADPRSVVSRRLLSVWLRRRDLQRAFPQWATTDQWKLIQWALSFGRAEGDVRDDDVAFYAVLPIADGVLQRTDDFGVNIAGFLRAQLGIGQIARRVREAVDATGIPSSLWPVALTLSASDPTVSLEPPRAIYPVTIAVINADLFDQWRTGTGAIFEETYTVASWAWETSDLPPQFHEEIAHVDELWVISQFIADNFRRHTDIPVYVLPTTVTPQQSSRSANGDNETPYFFFAFDYFSSIERKNPFALVDAFTRAFADGEGPRLVIKTVNAQFRPRERDRLHAAIAGRSDIELIERYLPESEVTDLIAGCAAYVSLHAAEGLGLTLLEAMFLGRPAVATAYSGNLDFMRDDTSYLVPFALVPIPSGTEHYDHAGTWAAADVDAAAAILREIVADPASANERAQRGRRDVAERYSAAAAAHFVHERLTTIERELTQRRANATMPPESSMRLRARLRRRLASLVAPPSEGRL